MTITITALTNDRARLIVKRAQFDHCIKTADMVQAAWEAEGYIVLRSEED